jgi:hypothetical protein
VRFSEVIDQLVQRLAVSNGDHPQAVESIAGELEDAEAEPAVTLPVPASDAVITPASLARATAAAESMNLGLHLGSAVLRIADGANRGSEGAAELRQAIWLIERYIELLDVRALGADINAEQRRLAYMDETIARMRALSAQMTESTAATPVESSESAPAGPSAPTAAAEPPALHPPLGREIAFMAARWAVIVVSVIVVVLAVTLIADLR